MQAKSLAEMREDQARERKLNQELHEESRKRHDNLSAMLLDEARKSWEMFQELLSRSNAQPILSLQPASPAPQLMIANQSSASNNSGASSLPSDAVIPPMVLASAPAIDPILTTPVNVAAPSSSLVIPEQNFLASSRCSLPP